MKIWVRDYGHGDKNNYVYTMDQLFATPDAWAPLVVMTEREFDYLTAMMLMYGVNVTLFLRELPAHYPKDCGGTVVLIPHLD